MYYLNMQSEKKIPVEEGFDFANSEVYNNYEELKEFADWFFDYADEEMKDDFREWFFSENWILTDEEDYE